MFSLQNVKVVAVATLPHPPAHHAGARAHSHSRRTGHQGTARTRSCTDRQRTLCSTLLRELHPTPKVSHWERHLSPVVFKSLSATRGGWGWRPGRRSLAVAVVAPGHWQRCGLWVDPVNGRQVWAASKWLGKATHSWPSRRIAVTADLAVASAVDPWRRLLQASRAGRHIGDPWRATPPRFCRPGARSGQPTHCPGSSSQTVTSVRSSTSSTAVACG